MFLFFIDVFCFIYVLFYLFVIFFVVVQYSESRHTVCNVLKLTFQALMLLSSCVLICLTAKGQSCNKLSFHRCAHARAELTLLSSHSHIFDLEYAFLNVM